MNPEVDSHLVLDVRGLTKNFGDFTANDNITFDVRKGDIHCLLGENGAGKSTLAKCIYGASKPDSGSIFFKGNKVSFSSPRDAINMGIGMVHQHFVLSEPMNAVENIIVGEESTGSILNLKKEKEKIQLLCDQNGVKINLNLPISQLSVGEQQWIEILKALYVGVDLLLLDEPTAVLTPQEVKQLFSVISKMAEKGITIIMITHKLHEVLSISKRVTVLRKSKSISTVITNQSTKASLANLLVGRNFDFKVNKIKLEIGPPVLVVDELSVQRDNQTIAIDNVSLTVHEGEVLGLAGVSGNGQKELFDALVGVRKPFNGKIRLNDEVISNDTPAQISMKGIASVPQDRLKEGLVGDFSVKENLILGFHKNLPFCVKSILNMKEINDFSSNAIKNYDIRTTGIDQKVQQLSGGNLQKVILAREISQPKNALIASSPTRGLDINATYYVYNRFLELLKLKTGILLISEDLDELFNLADRIAVIYNGRIMGEYNIEEATLEKIGMLMAGINEEEVEY